jgi:fatty-acid desaturase
MIKSKTMRWVLHVARTGSCEVHTRFWMEIVRERGKSEDLSVDGRVGETNGFIWLWIGTCV